MFCVVHGGRVTSLCSGWARVYSKSADVLRIYIDFSCTYLKISSAFFLSLKRSYISTRPLAPEFSMNFGPCRPTKLQECRFHVDMKNY